MRQITVNTLEDITLSGLPFIYVILFGKQHFYQKKIRRSFNRDNQYGLGRDKWYGKVTTTTKQYKIDQRNTYYWAKKRCILSRRPHLDIKEVKILTKSDVPQDIKMRTQTEF